MRAVEADVALALLLGIVEGVRVEEGPDELAADVFEAEFEMGVLVDGVMAAVEGGGADVQALFVGDFFGDDQTRGVAGASRCDSGIVGMREGVAEGDARGGAVSTSSPGRALSNMRDWEATMGNHSTRRRRGN